MKGDMNGIRDFSHFLGPRNSHGSLVSWTRLKKKKEKAQLEAWIQTPLIFGEVQLLV